MALSPVFYMGNVITEEETGERESEARESLCASVCERRAVITAFVLLGVSFVSGTSPERDEDTSRQSHCGCERRPQGKYYNH